MTSIIVPRAVELGLNPIENAIIKFISCIIDEVTKKYSFPLKRNFFKFLVVEKRTLKIIKACILSFPTILIMDLMD